MSDDTLGGEGIHLYVTGSAAIEFGRAADLQLEEARRRLTELLMDARRIGDDDTRWRARSRVSGWDIDAHVSTEGRLDVVYHVHARRVATRKPR